MGGITFDKKSVAIWWLNEDAFEAMNEKEIELLSPQTQQLLNRVPETASGKLIVPEAFDGYAIDSKYLEASSNGRWAAEGGFVGVVVARTELDNVKALPGFVTDHELQRL
jgi:hypothetical protein